MAGDFATVSTTSLKNAYPSKVVDAMINEEQVFRPMLKSELPAGAKFTESIMKFAGVLAPPQNVGQMVDGGTLPPVKERSDVQFTLTPTLFSVAVQIGFVTRVAGSSNKSGFNGGEEKRRVNEAIKNLGKFIESTYVGTHGTGRRARVEAATTNANTFTASLPEATRLLKKNYYITIRTTDGGVTVDGTVDLKQITTINKSTRLVTFAGDGTHDLTAGSHVHVPVEIAQTLTSVFANGLRGLIDDATFLETVESLSRTTNPELKANVFANGGTLRNLSEQILVRACHEIRSESEKSVDVAICSEGQIEKYLEFVAPDRRLMRTGKSDTGNMATGYKQDDMVHYYPGGSFLLKPSFDCVGREIFLLNWGTFFHYISREPGWWDMGGGGIFMPTPASGAYKASFLGYQYGVENIGCDNFKGNGVVRDLRDPSIGDA